MINVLSSFLSYCCKGIWSYYQMTACKGARIIKDRQTKCFCSTRPFSARCQPILPLLELLLTDKEQLQKNPLFMQKCNQLSSLTRSRPSCPLRVCLEHNCLFLYLSSTFDPCTVYNCVCLCLCPRLQDKALWPVVQTHFHFCLHVLG